MKFKFYFVTLLAMFAGVFSESFSQNYNGTFQEFFLGRQPSARAEAMGRGLSAITGDALSYYYNPAGIASLKGLNLSGSFASPYYFYEEGKYNFFSASYKIDKYGTIGLSRDYFDFGYENEIVITDEFGNVIGTETYDPDLTGYRLTLSSEVIKDLFVGANLNLLHTGTNPELTVGNETKGENKDVFYLDLGVIKSFNMKSKNLFHGFNIGTSMINVNFAEYSPADAAQGDPLPVIFRLGASYNLSVDDKNISPKLNSYNFVVNLEYEDLLNSKYYSGFHGGVEFTFLEIVSLRAGYFTMENRSYSTVIDDSGNVISYQQVGFNSNEFTYGFGLNIPIRQLTDSKTPLEIKFDYVNLKQPALNERKDDWENFQVYTIIVNWIF
jgi:hypothetical protein